MPLLRHVVIPFAVLLAATVTSPARTAPKAFKECLDGPQGLKACELFYYYDPDGTGSGPATVDDILPQRLVMYRYGRRLYSLEGSPFVWNFLFLENGLEMAFEAGPLHSSMLCTLILTATGKAIGGDECFFEEDFKKGQPWMLVFENFPGQQLSREPLEPSEIPK